ALHRQPHLAFSYRRSSPIENYRRTVFHRDSGGPGLGPKEAHMRAFEPHGPDSRPRGSGNHQSYQTAFRGSLGVLANPPDMHGAANGGCRDAVLAGARHSPFERKHGRELPEAAAGID